MFLLVYLFVHSGPNGFGLLRCGNATPRHSRTTRLSAIAVSGWV